MSTYSEAEQSPSELLALIENTEKVKGRYYTEIAWRRLVESAKIKEQGK